jgi:hypothetical protein
MKCSCLFSCPSFCQNSLLAEDFSTLRIDKGFASGKRRKLFQEAFLDSYRKKGNSMGLELSTTRIEGQKKLTILIYGRIGIGKTTIAKTLPVSNDSEVLYIRVEDGTLSLNDKDFHCHTIRTLNDIQNFRKNVAQVCAEMGIKWIVVDTIGKVGDIMAEGFKALYPSNSDKFKVWDEVGTETRNLINSLRWLDSVSVLFLGHESDDKVENRFSIVPYFPGKVGTKYIMDEIDLIGHYRLEYIQNQQRRALQFDPTVNPQIATKDRSGVLTGLTFPDIGQIKEKVQAIGLTI